MIRRLIDSYVEAHVAKPVASSAKLAAQKRPAI
jgi:hypothetical protein